MVLGTIANIRQRAWPSLVSWIRTVVLGVGAVAALMLLGCGAATVPVVGAVGDTGAAMYATQASQQSTAATLAARPEEVYAAMLRLAEASDLRLVKTDQSRLQLEMAQGDKRLRAEATALGDSETLLHIWVNTGSTGQPARDYAREFLRQLSEELDVEHTLVDI